MRGIEFDARNVFFFNFYFILSYFEEEDKILGFILEFDIRCYCSVIHTYLFNYFNKLVQK